MIEKILEELKAVRPEMLNPEAKRLFDAIMKIADERDIALYKQKKAIEYINKVPLQKGTEMYRIDLLNILEK